MLLDLQGSGPPLPLTDPAEVFFKHRHEDGNCPAITACSLSQEEIDARKYNGATESRLHRCMKGWLCKCPTQDGQVSDIVQEPTWKDALTRARRRPDVRATVSGRRIAFEVQLSTTHLSAIEARRDFYQQEGGLLFYIFAEINAGHRVPRGPRLLCWAHGDEHAFAESSELPSERPAFQRSIDVAPPLDSLCRALLVRSEHYMNGDAMISSRSKLGGLIAAAVISVMAASAMAQVVVSELTVSSVVKQRSGEEQLAPAQSVKPGDLLQYTATYRNDGNQAVKRLAATLPIPLGTEFVGASAVPRNVLASVGGHEFEPLPLMRKVKRPDGQVVDVPVPLAEYRALRWPERELAAGATYVTSVRVRVTAAEGSPLVAVAPSAPR